MPIPHVAAADTDAGWLDLLETPAPEPESPYATAPDDVRPQRRRRRKAAPPPTARPVARRQWRHYDVWDRLNQVVAFQVRRRPGAV